MKTKNKLFFMLTLMFFASTCFASEKNAIKFTFLSWFTGSTKVSYERAFPNLKQSGEFCVGLISAGYDSFGNNPFGLTVRYGHKFFVGEYSTEKPLEGFFLRPEFIYTNFSYNDIASREISNVVALLGTFGYQAVIKNFIMDFWAGAGYDFGKLCKTGYHHGFRTFEAFNQKNDNIALSFSIRFGWTF